MLDLLDNEGIYNKVDSIRKEKAWSIYELAKKAGVHPNTIYHWRDNKSSPTLSLLDAVCTAFNITVIAFLMDENELMALTDEQKEVIRLWNTLSEEQKVALLSLMRSMTRSLGI